MEVIPVYMLPFSTVFLIFMIYSFIGWCSEVLYVGIFFEHKFVNGGKQNGTEKIKKNGRMGDRNAVKGAGRV